MKNIFLPVFITAMLFLLPTEKCLYANSPDSVYLFAYGEENGSGLYYSWSNDLKNWHTIGHNHTFLRSDYGRWGSQKRMYNPILFLDNSGLWHCIWTLNNEDGALAHTSSSDLVYWMPQSYPVLMPGGNCLNPEIRYDKNKGSFQLFWENNKSDGGLFTSFTNDFKTYEPATAAKEEQLPNQRKEFLIGGNKKSGTVHLVASEVIDHLINAHRVAQYKQILNGERVGLSPNLFREEVTAHIRPDINRQKAISDMLIGIFYEDINYAADGGLTRNWCKIVDLNMH